MFKKKALCEKKPYVIIPPLTRHSNSSIAYSKSLESASLFLLKFHIYSTCLPIGPSSSGIQVIHTRHSVTDPLNVSTPQSLSKCINTSL